MRSKQRIIAGLVLASGLATFGATACFAQAGKSQLVERTLTSKNFAGNKIGTDPIRKMTVYLPAGYDEATGSVSSRRYPVIYFFASPFDKTYRSIIDEKDAQGVFDRAIGAGVIDKFILVCVDMNTPAGSSWYVNSPVTGNWEDFVVQELVPYVDANFKTLANRDSRGISGIFMGGHGAIRLAMKHPDVVGSVYGMHPVGTGSGVKPLASLPDWNILENAKSLDDVKKDGYTRIFTGIFQAFLPDTEKLPIYIDLVARKNGDELVIDAKLMERLRSSFFLESMIPQYAENLKSLRGFKFDWARSDLNYDHVYSNQAYSHKLNEFGIVHEAEEYNGTWGEQNWGLDGRVYTEVLPFFQRHLVFQAK